MKYKIKTGLINSDLINDLVLCAEKIDYVTCEPWLGYHKYIDYDLTNVKSSEIPESFLNVANRVLGLFKSDQKYNKMVLRKYNEGDEGKPHSIRET